MEKQKSKPWSGICCRACWYARGKRCVCRCGGKYHGQGWVKEKPEEEKETNT